MFGVAGGRARVNSPESESMGDSDSLVKFSSESEFTLSFWRFFTDMGKRGSGGGGREGSSGNKKRGKN